MKRDQKKFMLCGSKLLGFADIYRTKFCQTDEVHKEPKNPFNTVKSLLLKAIYSTCTKSLIEITTNIP
jgi:hypothetical protein